MVKEKKEEVSVNMIEESINTDLKQKEDLILKQNELIKSQEKEIEKLKKKREKEYKRDRTIRMKIIPGLLKFVGFLIIASPIVMGIGLMIQSGNAYGQLVYGLLGSVIFSVAMLLLVIYLAKKTHALLELKSNISGNPISIFLSDSKRITWKSIKPEHGLIEDPKSGTYLINESANYIDPKTKNLFIFFNENLGTSASVESYALADSLAKVFRDQSQLNVIRKYIMAGKVEGNDVVIRNYKNEVIDRYSEIGRIKENIDFSHLKSLLNSITPQGLAASVEMKVLARIKSYGNTNIKQLIMIFLMVLGAGGLLYIIIKSVQGGNTSVVQSVVPAAKAVATKTATGTTIGG